MVCVTEGIVVVEIVTSGMVFSTSDVTEIGEDGEIVVVFTAVDGEVSGKLEPSGNLTTIADEGCTVLVLRVSLAMDNAEWDYVILKS